MVFPNRITRCLLPCADDADADAAADGDGDGDAAADAAADSNHNKTTRESQATIAALHVVENLGHAGKVPTGLIVMAAGWVGIGDSPRQSKNEIGWYKPKGTKDITNVYSGMLEMTKAGYTKLPTRYTYLFVPGFMWTRYPGEIPSSYSSILEFD